jgi:predicted signal transduction protein with EAL and GGDEF domain
MNDSLPQRSRRLSFDGRIDGRFEPRSDPAAARRPSLAVVVIRLDGATPMDPGAGGQASEALQHLVAAALMRAVGNKKLLNALASGEFACLLADLPTREQLSLVAWKLLDALAVPMQAGAFTPGLRPSIGIARWPEDASHYEGLLRHAGAAMYRARRQKSGFAFFDELADVWEHDGGTA